MDVIILAGAKNSGALRESSDCPFEAGIIVAGRTLLDYVVQSLLDVREAERIAVVGPEESLSPDLRTKVWQIVPFGGSMVENLRRGMLALAPKGKVLVATADIPLLTAEAVEDFLARCGAHEADVYYPVVSRERIEARYPTAKRTYASLREGTFTGGNIILLAPEIVERHLRAIEQAVALRKKPLQMGRMLGLWYLLKLVFGRLSIAEIEERVGRKMHFKGMAVITPFAEIGIDVDKPSDLALVQSALAGEASPKPA